MTFFIEISNPFQKPYTYFGENCAVFCCGWVCIGWIRAGLSVDILPRWLNNAE
jgi:hypothetical protein